MRHGRAKAARKTLKFYSRNSSGRIGGDGSDPPPYRVLCDGNFLAASVRHKIPLRDRITKILQQGGDTKKVELLVLRSALDELKGLADAHAGGQEAGEGEEGEAEAEAEAGAVFRAAWQFGLDECEIVERDAAVPRAEDEKAKGGGDAGKKGAAELGDPARDILRLVTGSSASGGGKSARREDVPPNPAGYLVGTQDEALAGVLRSMPLMPQLRLSRVVLLLEAPSAASRRYAAGLERRKERSGGGLMTDQEREMISTVRKQDRADARGAREREKKEEERSGGFERRKKRKAKGPNPLSCKKGKAADASGGGSSEKTRRRKRK